jgi:hypothetical protein
VQIRAENNSQSKSGRRDFGKHIVKPVKEMNAIAANSTHARQ